MALERAPWSGLPYGGGFLSRAASQSNGLEADSDGELSGVIVCEICVRGVEGTLPFGGDLPSGDFGVIGLPSSDSSRVVLRGEFATELAFACANRRNIAGTVQKTEARQGVPEMRQTRASQEARASGTVCHSA